MPSPWIKEPEILSDSGRKKEPRNCPSMTIRTQLPPEKMSEKTRKVVGEEKCPIFSVLAAVLA